MALPRKISFQITWRCDIRCGHCVQDHTKQDLDNNACKKIIRETSDLGLIDTVGFTGGEPFVVYERLLDLVLFSHKLGLKSTVVTNARWAKNAKLVRERIGTLHAVGLERIAISFDSFHADFVPIRNVLTIIEEAELLGLKAEIYASVSGEEEGRRTEDLLSEINKQTDVTIKKRSVINAGAIDDKLYPIYANKFKEASSLTVCPSTTLFTIWPDGRVMPCCSAGTHESLAFANIHDNSTAEILDKLHSTRVISVLREKGPAGLVPDLDKSSQDEVIAQKYCSDCDMCYNVLKKLKNSETQVIHIQEVNWI